MTDANSTGGYVNLLIEVDAPVGVVTIHRPQALNALDARTLDEIARALAELEADTAVRGIIITGSGSKAFVAGADIKELRDLDVLGGVATSHAGQRLFRQVESLSKPVIAAINGFALGGGCELALACDIRLASPNARLGLPETGLGLIPGYGGTQRLPRLVGKGLALEMMLTGMPVSAEEALRMGLVNRILPAEELLEGAREMVRQIARNAPLAVAAARQAVHQGAEVDLERGLAIEALHFGVLFSTADKTEGLSAFIEKRRPEFGGH